MNPKENDNEIIELTDEELDEIFVDDDFDNGEDSGEIPTMPPRGSFLSMRRATLW